MPTWLVPDQTGGTRPSCQCAVYLSLCPSLDAQSKYTNKPTAGHDNSLSEMHVKWDTHIHAKRTLDRVKNACKFSCRVILGRANTTRALKTGMVAYLEKNNPKMDLFLESQSLWQQSDLSSILMTRVIFMGMYEGHHSIQYPHDTSHIHEMKVIIRAQFWSEYNTQPVCAMNLQRWLFVVLALSEVVLRLAEGNAREDPLIGCVVSFVDGCLNPVLEWLMSFKHRGFNTFTSGGRGPGPRNALPGSSTSKTSSVCQ